MRALRDSLPFSFFLLGPSDMSWQTQATTNKGLIDGLCQHGIIKSDDVRRAMQEVDRGNFVER